MVSVQKQFIAAKNIEDGIKIYLPGVQCKYVLLTFYSLLLLLWIMVLLDDVLSEVELSPGDFIGLDHVDKSGRSNRLGAEKAIFIRG